MDDTKIKFYVPSNDSGISAGKKAFADIDKAIKFAEENNFIRILCGVATSLPAEEFNIPLVLEGYQSAGQRLKIDGRWQVPIGKYS